MHTRLALAAFVLSAAPALAQDADGAAIFEESCAACHGAEGPLPASAMAALEEEAFAEALAGHPDVGDAVSSLGEEEIAALHAYIVEQAGE